MLTLLNRKLHRLCSKLRWPPSRRRSKPKIVIKKLVKSNSIPNNKSRSGQRQDPIGNGSATVHPNGTAAAGKPVRVATFNAALFSMAPVVPKIGEESFRMTPASKSPRGILKQSPLHPACENASENELFSKQQKYAKSKLRVSINLPDNEISLKRSGRFSFVVDDEKEEGSSSSKSNGGRGVVKGKSPLMMVRSSNSLRGDQRDVVNGSCSSSRSVVDVLREVNADILALQDVKAEEEKGMKPLSDLAEALGMNYVFAESWAPEYGNAILSKWPIKRWHVQKIFDDADFRNVLKATIDVPKAGEVNFQCTLLDHLDENWRKKQISAIIQSNDGPHILAGGLNSLDETDYSPERWTDIVKYYEEMGKPTPKAEVMRFLKSKSYTDAKDFAGECESVVMITKGQSVQGTCKYGTRVDYILASPESPYEFVPGSYSVSSSKGTSDHHIVQVDIVKGNSKNAQHCNNNNNNNNKKQRQQKQKIVKIDTTTSAKGIWKLQKEIDR